MFYKFTLEISTYKKLNSEDIHMLNLHNLTYEQYLQSNNQELTVVSIIHPCEFAYGDFYFDKYEPWYIQQIENFGELLKQKGFEEFQIFIQVFCIEDDSRNFPQCNFEIFNNKLLKRLSKYDVSIPISIYAISKEQAMDYLNITLKDLESKVIQ